MFWFPFLSVLVTLTCGRLSWPVLWSTFRRTRNSDWFIDWLFGAQYIFYRRV